MECLIGPELGWLIIRSSKISGSYAGSVAVDMLASLISGSSKLFP
jgi:hypothetical protein